MGKFHSKHVYKRESPEGECYIVRDHPLPLNTSGSSPYSCPCCRAPLKSAHDCTNTNTPTEEKTSTESKTEEKVSSLYYNVPLRVFLPPLTTEKSSVEDNSRPTILTAGVGSGMAPTQKQTMTSQGHQSDTTDNNEDKQPNVEEIECDVSVAGSTTSNKQDWSFTLYDFDGRGKITKEDIGRLLQSLYDAVGSSIALPDVGTKTLKLRLTVSPDKAKLEKCEKSEKSDKRGNVGTDVTDIRVSVSPSKLKQKQTKNNLSRGSKRLSSQEHRHLVNLVQKNMERNCPKTAPASGGQKQKARHHKSDVPRREPRSPTRGENAERRSYYLDLAGVEHVDVAPTAPTGAALSAGISPTHVRSPKPRPSTFAHGHCLDAAEPAAESKPRRLHESPRKKKNHRSREEDQERAMQQVAAWIQIQESNPELTTGQSSVTHHHHEHHHHHHYHHYHEA